MRNDMKRLTRRQFIKLMFSGAFLVSFLLALKSGTAFSLSGIKRFLTVKLDYSTPTGLLDKEQLETITRFAKRLIPLDSSPGVSTSWVHNYVNNTTDTESGYLLEYQHVVMYLDVLTAERYPAIAKFHSLADSEADNIISEMFDGLAMSSPWQKKIARLVNSGASKERCWDFVASKLIQAFYRSTAGWSIRGYDKYPGIAGEPRAYTAPPQSPGATSAFNEIAKA